MAGGILPQASEIPRSSRSRLSEQSFELGGDRLDGVESGVFRQEDQASSDIPDRIPYRVSLVGAEIVRDRHWPLTSASSGGPSTPECRFRSCSSQPDSAFAKMVGLVGSFGHSLLTCP
jgi:hypothetical protein